MKKNILVLSPTPSHPQDAGNRKRIYALTKYLQELGATIYFVYCPREWDREIPKDAYEGMNQCWDYFFVAYPVQPAVHQTDDEYFDIDAWWDVGIEFTINWIKLAVDIDMFVCNYVFYSRALELFDESVTKVIDTHDIVSNRNYLLEKKLGYRDFFFASPDSEKKALDRAHVVLSIKEDESTWFKCLSSTPVLTIGHLESEPDAIVPREIDYGNLKLGFIGSANPINCKNLESFLDEYFAIYGESNEKISFIIGGKICKVLDQRFHNKVEILGMVDNVSQFYEQVDIIVLPFEFSTGLKIKTVEALSWSKPCMGTINAFEGLGSDCTYHSYKSIKALAEGIEVLIEDSQATVAKIKQDSRSVYDNYSNKVKDSIKRLYQTDWKTVKDLQQPSSNISTTLEAKAESSPKQVYNFNLVSNVDFWNLSNNEELWIDFWIKNVRKLGNLNVYRTASFNDIEKDKLELYKLGLVNNVHYRELYQIVDLFRIDPDEDQIFINLFDFGSIIYNQSCLEELEKIQLSANHFLWYFFNKQEINNNPHQEYIQEIFQSDRHIAKTCYLSDLASNLIPNQEVSRHNILLSSNPIDISSRNVTANSLNKVTIGTSCLQEESIAELNKLALCCREFLPKHFELVIFSDLEIVKDNYAEVNSLQNMEASIQMLDIFICLEAPESISFIIYLCICHSVMVNYKDRGFADRLPSSNLVQPLHSLTSIPEVYSSYLEQFMFTSKHDPNFTKHDSFVTFIEYWLDQCQLSSPKQLNCSTIN
ncbi:MAG: glycosyltransferase [Cyanobacteria bacterium P01_G01_bin.39]